MSHGVSRDYVHIQNLVGKRKVVNILFHLYFNRKVRAAALEVYQRRALISYDIEGLLHEEMDDTSAVVFKFRLPEAHPNSSFAQRDYGIMQRTYKRFGAMAAFENFEHFQTHFLRLLELFRIRSLDDDSRDLDLIDGLHVGSPPVQPPQQQLQPPQFQPSTEDNFQYILNVAVKSNTDNDSLISQLCADFCQTNAEVLSENEIRRVTFIVLRSKGFPKYFTFRARNDYKEDLVYVRILFKFSVF